MSTPSSQLASQLASQLELRIDALIKTVTQLRYENQLLRQELSRQLHQTQNLHDRNTQAKSRLMTLIHQLDTESAA
jgi:uncharacterized protein (TIGR02449 family)